MNTAVLKCVPCIPRWCLKMRDCSIFRRILFCLETWRTCQTELIRPLQGCVVFCFLSACSWHCSGQSYLWPSSHILFPAGRFLECQNGCNFPWRTGHLHSLGKGHASPIPWSASPLPFAGGGDWLSLIISLGVARRTWGMEVYELGFITTVLGELGGGG